jgi:hypothetical protein
MLRCVLAGGVVRRCPVGSMSGVDLGTFGIWTFDFERQPTALMRESLQELEELGWGRSGCPSFSGARLSRTLATCCPALSG